MMATMELERYLDGWRAREQQDSRAVEQATRKAWEAVPVVVDLLRGRGARRIWLVGSLARGTFETHSDLDFLVEGLDEDQAIRAALDASERTGFGIDLIRTESLDPEWLGHHRRYGKILHG